MAEETDSRKTEWCKRFPIIRIDVEHTNNNHKEDYNQFNSDHGGIEHSAFSDSFY